MLPASVLTARVFIADAGSIAHVESGSSPTENRVFIVETSNLALSN